MFKFSDIVQIQGETESVTEKNISDGKEMTENVNYNRSETEFASVEDPLNMCKTASKETILVSEIPNIINEENVIIATGQGKIPVSILRDEFCEEQAFPHLPKSKFGYNMPRDITLSPAWYFNQRLLNFNQYFVSRADYIFFARSVYEQHHLRSTINFAMHKIKSGTLGAAGAVKSWGS